LNIEFIQFYLQLITCGEILILTGQCLFKELHPADNTFWTFAEGAKIGEETI